MPSLPFALLLRLCSHHSWHLTDSIFAQVLMYFLQPKLLYLYTQQLNKELLSEEQFIITNTKMTSETLKAFSTIF